MAFAVWKAKALLLKMTSSCSVQLSVKVALLIYIGAALVWEPVTTSVGRSV